MLASTGCFYVIELQTDQGIVQVSTPFKIILGILAALVGLIVYNGIKAQSDDVDSSSRSTTPIASSQPASSIPAGSGWADSRSLFVSRWNSMAAAGHELLPFQTGAKGTIALFDGGSVHYFDMSQERDSTTKAIYAVAPYDRSRSVSACAMGYAAATGQTYQAGSQVVHEALSAYLANPNPLGGAAQKDGYLLMFSVQGDGSVDCSTSKNSGR